ncbi:MAG: hypothetical protein K0S37_295 [Microbacterium sp.]|nr:hypothetical protein [Microbacterium sp.]
MNDVSASWDSRFTSVRTDPASFDAAALELARADLGADLGFAEPFLLPRLLVEMLESGVEWCSRVAGDRYAEFGWIGADMAGVFRSYELAEYMPRAVPIAFDGGGGLYLLDARAGRNDGVHPVVWSHAGSLSWDEGEYRPVAADFASFVRDDGAT